MEWEEKTLEEKIVFSGKVVRLRLERVALPGGGEATREIVEHPGAVVIVPLTEAGEVVLVRQYRKAIGRVTWELPAGTLEPGEEPAACARRELKEETGLEASEWHPVIEFYSSPGFCTEKMYLFRARGLSQGPAATDPDERISCGRFLLDEALEMARRGEIADAKTLVGLLAAKYWD
jgi:ADP-ribose pyrophosphatase